jgi:serine/threonine protein kinase
MIEARAATRHTNPALAKRAAADAGHRRSGPVLRGQVFGQYRVEKKLGEGAFGQVYVGRDLRLKRRVAIKVLGIRSGGIDVAWGALLREARIAAALNYPGICTLYDVGEAGGFYYMAMEYARGKTLRHILRSGPLDPTTALDYATQTVSAVDYAHSRGVIHNDIKSSNVMITEEGGVKLLDFGLARHPHWGEVRKASHSRSLIEEVSGLAGTLPYMAPEVLRGHAPSVRSDIWSLGVLFYEMCTGKLPFAGQTPFELSMLIMTQPTPDLPSTVVGGMSAAISRCLVKDSAARLATAQDLLAELKKPPRLWSEMRQLRILLLEDEPIDVELTLRALRAGGLDIDPKIVRNMEEFSRALDLVPYDAILADLNVPGSHGLDSYDEARSRGIDVPFILVTGTLGDRAAVECIRRGISDCVLKRNLFRLPVALERALSEKALSDARNRVEAELHTREMQNWPVGQRISIFTERNSFGPSSRIVISTPR